MGPLSRPMWAAIVLLLGAPAVVAHDKGKVIRLMRHEVETNAEQALSPNREDNDVKAVDGKAVDGDDASDKAIDKRLAGAASGGLADTERHVVTADGHDWHIAADGHSEDGRTVGVDGALVDSYDLLTDDAIVEQVCDWRFGMRQHDDFSKNWLSGIHEGQVICVNGDHQDWTDTPLPKFMTQILPKINVKFVLVTTESDGSTPHPKVRHLLNETKLINWYTWNMGEVHPKLKPLPIGLNNGRMGKLMRLTLNKSKRVPWENRVDKVVFNFALSTGKPSTRQSLYDMGQNWSFAAYEPYVTNRVEVQAESNDFYASVYDKYKFVACPVGWGIDTHRVWEALYLGAIPIVIKNSLSAVYENLPVVQLDSWADLPKRWGEIKNMEAPKPYSSFDVLKMSHWVKKLKENEKPASSI